ncbi:alkaline phosphatase family protein [Pseudophaeobacter sp.]|uniref:alkaline phosphatase family protein n=1 Tax=Pseudophaeobacter sp. TaxID=1971739 RepID=UPI0026315221|nr:alkaline phosphatase family protein [Pseudophaeobacter sp.]
MRLILLVSGLLITSTMLSAQGRELPPKLIVQITVDQLRADLLERFATAAPGSGFQRLMSNGVWFRNAEHRHANTETVVGHTTLSTGADPAVHGLIGNNYLDSQLPISAQVEQNSDSAGIVLDVSDALHFATQDDTSPLLYPDGSLSSSQDGRSPRDLLVTTIGDEIRLSRGAAAKIFGVSMKDRAAIGATGHAGTAYWYNTEASTFLSSVFYVEDYPDWLRDWTDLQLPAAYAGTGWELLHPETDYAFADYDDQPWEKNYPGWGIVFPDHLFPDPANIFFQAFLETSPAADELTLSFAKALIAGEDLGADAVTDYLAISLNSVDYIGHAFGPSSLEAEDNLKRLDAQLGAFFNHLDQVVGLGNTLVVLSADHGATEVPGYMNTRLRTNVQLFDYAQVEQTPAVQKFKAAHGITDPISSYTSPWIYLDHPLLLAAGADPAKAEALITATLRSLPGLAWVFENERIAQGDLPDTHLGRAVTANFLPSRSGDLYPILSPGWFMKDPDPLAGASQHGSPYAYDRHVPVFFMGPGIRPQTVYRKVQTVDVAPTIAAYARTRLPSGTSGHMLPEIFD